MPSTSNSNAGSLPAFELKGRMLTLSVLRLLSTDQALLTAQLDARMASMPELFRHLPVVLDLEAVQGQPLDLPRLIGSLRQRGLVPVGVRAGAQADEEAAVAAGLGVISLGAEPVRRAEPVREPTAASAATAASLIVRQPVRSGQQIYARGGDLIVLASVSAGAEVLADGHIHIYGALRGRALAGVQGDNSSRIFCQSLEAELVSIAGAYRISENIQETGQGRPVQVYLDGEALCIQPL